MELELGYIPLRDNFGYYIEKVPQNVLDELKIQIDELQNNFSIGKNYNNQLIGEIKHEYEISLKSNTQHFIEYFTEQIEPYSQTLSNKIRGIESVYSEDIFPQLEISDLWVNFQQKYEYNPIHKHRGLYSFVIWYQIPYTFEEEHNYTYKSNLNHSPHGSFSFVYPQLINNEINILVNGLPIDKNKEGYCAIFPSSLHHMVAPFYSSDKYRITVAGNVLIKQ